MTALIVFVIAGLGTYAARSVFILTLGSRSLPDAFERALRFFGPAVLAALVASLLTSPGGIGGFLGNVPEVVGAVAGALLAWRTRRLMVSFLGAIVVFFALQAVL